MEQLQSNNLFTTSQVAEMLGVTRVTVFRWITEGRILAQKIGRNYLITHTEVLKHVDTKTLNEEKKAVLRTLVDKAVHDYGETIRMLGGE